jgi:Flp pilus assembly protein TadD
MRCRPVAALVAAMMIACSKPAVSEAGSGAVHPDGVLDPTLLALLDSAAAAYRDSDFESARRHYERALAIDSTLAAPWFGLFLVHRALGQAEIADSALRTVRRLAQRE